MMFNVGAQKYFRPFMWNFLTNDYVDNGNEGSRNGTYAYLNIFINVTC